MSSYSEGQVHQLADAMEGVGFTAKHLTRLGQSSALLENLRLVLDGVAKIKPIDHMVDLSIPCKLPFNGAERVSPVKSGVVKLEKRDDDLYLDGVKVDLFLSENQKAGSTIIGHNLRKELEARGGNISAKVLDHLVEHPELWPESWKKDTQGNTIYVFFWDDIFRDSLSSLCVRFGCWDGGRVVSGYDWLGCVWDGYSPAAFLASST
ncbi:MAG: hypothetical protein V1711_02320 [bacterium]